MNLVIKFLQIYFLSWSVFGKKRSSLMMYFLYLPLLYLQQIKVGIRIKDRYNTPNPITTGPFGCSVYSKYPPIAIHRIKTTNKILNNIFIKTKLQKVLSLNQTFPHESPIFNTTCSGYTILHNRKNKSSENLS